jgi:succinoglycan biosynthesis protein ExoM
MPLFSIVTVCRNAEATIRRAGLSLRGQTFRDFEWLVVDGASTDGTLDVIASLKVDGVRVSSEPDQGIYDAMNKAIGLARGQVLYFLNADDELHDANVLAEVASHFSADAELDCLYGDVIFRSPGREILKRCRHINRSTLPFEDLCHQGVFARRTLFSRVGLFELRWPTSADYDWLLRVFASGANVKYVERRIAFFAEGGAHARNPKSLAQERHALRLHYMSPLSLAIGSWISRAAHKASKLLRRGHRIGESTNDAAQRIDVNIPETQGGPKVLSICICTFRRPVTLDRAIRSVQALALPGDLEVELVVVDNDPAGSAQVVAERAAQGGSIALRYFVEPRSGVSFARNRCVDEARGEWIAFFDDDEYVDRDWLNALWSAARSHGAAAVFGPVIAEFALPPPAWLLATGSHLVSRYPTGTTMDYRECRTSSVLFHRRLHAALDGFDPRFASSGAEDVDFFWRAIKAGARLVWCDSALVHEIVPAERMVRGWLLGRAFNLGRNFARLQAVHTGRSAYAVGFLRGVAAVLVFAPPALFLRLAGNSFWFASECKVAAGLGKMAAAFGEGRGDYALGSTRKSGGIVQRR